MKKVLFVCIENSCRSQMAEGFARRYGQGVVEVGSAGSNPAEEVDKTAIKVMMEKAIDISGQVPKQIKPEDLEDYDVIVTMGCGVEAMCPVIPAEKKRDWDLEDPKGKSLETYRKIRDEIEKKVRELTRELA